MSDPLFDALSLGDLALPNRIVMAPMTRGRATDDGVPTEIMAEYYRQRASAGLIVTEATSINPQAVGWVKAPGIWTDAQQAAWAPFTRAVHDAGGRIFLQLWHMGRASHPDFQAQKRLPVGPSAIAAVGQSHTATGKKPYVTPRALTTEELPGVVAAYVSGAERAVAAGFDGVEIHAANGYLLDQFIRDHSNRRDDEYGGSIPNRWRLPLEVVRAVSAAIGPKRTGIRLSPTGGYNDMADSDPVATFTYGAQQLEGLGIAFLHLLDPLPGHAFATPGAPLLHPHIRQLFSGPLILNGGYDATTGSRALAENQADAIAYGVPFLANPDLPERYRQGAELNAPDFARMYTDGAEGYTDYPSL
jgi:N-ethylmaleimide reductase